MAKAPKGGGSLFSKLAAMAKSKEYRDWVTSTHFWGPVANWAIPLAAIADFKKNPKYISPSMTIALILYSTAFMRFALRVQPRNLLLFACHCTNFSAQNVQGVRCLKYLVSNKE